MEQRIKAFLLAQGVPLFGIAGSHSLKGPPSTNPRCVIPDGKSAITLAMPMDVEAIYQFLSKESPAPHNIDQCVTIQRIQHIANKLAKFLRTNGYKAKAVPPSPNYRRSPYVFSNKPEFSHRLAAVASGVGALGWSGNLMTREYGAAVHLATVVTDADLFTDTTYDADYFIDHNCRKCKRCAAACPSGMFSAFRPEYLLMDGQLLERGRRYNQDLCHISCFGLHSLSRDKKWSNWGLHWIDKWLDNPPEPSQTGRLLGDLLKKGLSTGDSTQRFFALEKINGNRFPSSFLYDIPKIGDLPKDEDLRYQILTKLFKQLGIAGLGNYPIPMVCGHCALICGPNLKETSRRYNTLIKSGIVVPGKNGRMARAATFEEAKRIRETHPLKPSRAAMVKDAATSLYLWHKYYFGFQPRSALDGFLYKRKQAKAIRSLKSCREHRKDLVTNVRPQNRTPLVGGR